MSTKNISLIAAVVVIALLSQASESEGKRRKECSLCPTVMEILATMRNALHDLNREVCSLRRQMHENCSDSQVLQKTEAFQCIIDDLEKVFEDSSVQSASEVHSTTERSSWNIFDFVTPSDIDSAPAHVPTSVHNFNTPPTISEWCPASFRLVGGGCFRIFSDPMEWEPFGDAAAVCASVGAALAAPQDPDKLRAYLMDKNYETTFWIGAKRERRRAWEWVTGEEMDEGEWKKGFPSKNGSKRCIFWKHTWAFKAGNHFCGEKFAFICEYKHKK